jgi:hypothetical protein
MSSDDVKPLAKTAKKAATPAKRATAKKTPVKMEVDSEDDVPLSKAVKGKGKGKEVKVEKETKGVKKEKKVKE